MLEMAYISYFCCTEMLWNDDMNFVNLYIPCTCKNELHILSLCSWGGVSEESYLCGSGCVLFSDEHVLSEEETQHP